MKAFLIIFFSFTVLALHAQDSTSHTLMLQFGVIYGDDVNTNLAYEAMFYTKRSVQLGGMVGAGVWLKPSGFFGFEATERQGYHIMAAGCLKLGKGKSKFGVNTGYAYLKLDEFNGPIVYHRLVVELSYQYYAPRGFHARAGISSLQGLIFGFGKRIR